MLHIDDLGVLLNRFFHKRESKKREMRIVFQCKRYLEWKDLTTKEKF